MYYTLISYNLCYIIAYYILLYYLIINNTCTRTNITQTIISFLLFTTMQHSIVLINVHYIATFVIDSSREYKHLPQIAISHLYPSVDFSRDGERRFGPGFACTVTALLHLLLLASHRCRCTDNSHVLEHFFTSAPVDRNRAARRLSSERRCNKDNYIRAAGARGWRQYRLPITTRPRV